MLPDISYKSVLSNNNLFNYISVFTESATKIIKTIDQFLK